jgi:hypothetical protein
MPMAGLDSTTVYALDDCADLAPLDSDAERGDRVLVTSAESMRWAISPAERTFRTLIGFNIPDRRVVGEITFEQIPGLPGKVIGAVKVQPFWIVHWERNGRTWLGIHAENGEPESAAKELDVDGELFFGDPFGGLRFLRWADGVPVEMSTATVTLEWVAE